MKKNFLFIYMFIAGMLTLTSCGDDDTTTDPVDNSTEYRSVIDTEVIEGKSVEIVTVTDKGAGAGTMTWTKNKVYVLDGFVFVNSGQTLTIEAGTIIKGAGGQGVNASALIVAQGGKIMAQGTKTDPILFTSIVDESARDTDGALHAGDNLDENDKGLWGGLIVLGNAKLNSNPGTSQIEGIPTEEARGLYGGSNDADNSGTIKYVSIRHGGTNIGAGNEINGLTLGGVGSGTTIEYVEIVANKDDGIEFFGGAPRIKYAITAYCADDSYDYDEGFRGLGQFWLTIQDSDSDRGGEHDGGTSPEDGTPYAHPIIYNATYIAADGSGSRALTLRDNAGGEYHNSIFHGFKKGIDIEDLPGEGEDSKKRFEAGDIKFSNVVFSNVAAKDSILINFNLDTKTKDASGNTIYNTVAFSDTEKAKVSYSTTSTAGLSTTDVIAEGVTATGTAPTDAFFSKVTYIGAIDPSSSTSWIDGWSFVGKKLAK